METVKNGSVGRAVAALQHLLKIKVDGVFGAQTHRALCAFQTAQGLAADGIAGPQTWAALAQKAIAVRRGSRGDTVRVLQSLLGLKPDGIFGPGTHAAVVQFQRAQGLAADGIAGKNTWAALLGAPAKSAPSGSSGTDALLRRWGFGGIIDIKGLPYAVKQFQAAMGLAVDGIAGEKTTAALQGSVITPRISESEMACQCGVKHPGKGCCSGYPQGRGMAAGVLLLAERIFREVEKDYPGTAFYVANMAHPTGSKNQLAGGYRCDRWNRERGGAAGSRHKECIAADIYGTNPKYTDKAIRDRIEQVALQLATKGGVGYGARWVVHIDTRGVKARWKY